MTQTNRRGYSKEDMLNCVKSEEEPRKQREEKGPQDELYGYQC